MKQTLKIFLPVLLSACMLSCEKPEQLGPDVKGIYGPVTVTQTLAVSNANPDFSTETVYFTAAFENDAIWTLTIVGQTSGAVKTITGVSNQLGAFNAKWDGTADDAPSFLAENVTATLSFQSSATTLTTNLTIAGTKNLNVGGVLVTDFAVSKVADGNHTTTTLWRSDGIPTTTANNLYVKPDGNNYLYMSGIPWQGTPVTPYVDYMTIMASAADVNYGTYFPLYADPNKVYFNIMVYNTPSPDAWLKILIHEEGGTDAGGTTRYVDIRPDWSGWKLLSFNYTELLSDEDEPLKPNKVTAIQFVLLSDADPLPGAAVSTAFDHIIFTHNQPYQP